MNRRDFPLHALALHVFFKAECALNVAQAVKARTDEDPHARLGPGYQITTVNLVVI